MDEIYKQFEKVTMAFKTRNSRFAECKIYDLFSDELSGLMPTDGCNKSKLCERLKIVSENNVLSDYALDKQEICFLDLVQDKGKNSNIINDIRLYSFLYRCVLEALRIAALFHDIGHPPFSHIVEQTLNDIYKERYEQEKKFKQENIDYLNNCLGKYLDTSKVSSKPRLILCTDDAKTEKAVLHEQIGIDMLYKAYTSVLKNFVEERKNNTEDYGNQISTLFLISVIEFTFGILEEKSPIFKTLHRIIDGPVDVDRMDYVVRDSQNAGVNWGKIPYHRMISSVKFMKPQRNGGNENELVVAFPEKVSSEIDDLLVNRYKIFQRINYHHKSIRTSELLQRSVKFLAEDYLRFGSDKDDSESDSDSGSGKQMAIAPEIRDLWGAIGFAFGTTEQENKVSKWNDSWLISVLSNALITLSDSAKRSELFETRSRNEILQLQSMLEEIILNKKRYFPLLKRQRDAIRLRDMIQDKAKINDVFLDELSDRTNGKLREATGEAAESAIEGLYRINMLRTQILGKADLHFLNSFFRCGETFDNQIELVLEKAEQHKIITSYFMHPNSGHMKLGISDDSGIYLYRNKSEKCYEYNPHITLKPQLIAQRSGYLWLYVYVGINNKREEEIESIIQTLTDEIADSVASNLKKSLEELF